MILDSRARRALAAWLLLALGGVGPAARAAIVSVTFPVTAFRPNEPGPTRSTQAEIQVVLDADPSRYRLDAFRVGGTNPLVSTRTVDHAGPAGAPVTHRLRVPLDEGANSFTVRAIDVNRPSFALVSAATPVLTRDTRNTVTSVRLDRIEPLAARSTNQTTAALVFTIFGTSDSHAVEIEQNGLFGPPTGGIASGEQQLQATLVEGDNFFRVRVTTTDPLSADPMVTSNLLRIVRDTTPPTLVNVVVANPPLPTAQAVVNIQGDTEPFAVVTVDDGLGTLVSKRADQLGNFSLNGVPLALTLPGPTVTMFTVTARDDTGNVSPPVVLPATRAVIFPRFEFVRLTPFDGSVVAPDVAAQIDGLVGLDNAPYEVRFTARKGASLPVLEETLPVLADGVPFQKDTILSVNPVAPDVDVLWSFQATVTSTAGTSPVHFLGSVTVDAADPPPVTLLDTDFDSVPVFASRSFTLEGAAERESSVQFVGFNGVSIRPGTLVRTQPTPIAPGAEFRSVVDLALAADGEYSLASTVIATSGRTGLASRRAVPFLVDRTPPVIADLRVDGVDAEEGRGIFRGAGQVVTLSVRPDEFMPEPPEVYVTQQGAEAVRAIFSAEPVSGRVFEYLFATDLTQDFDGPVEVVVLGGGDRGGNVIRQERRFPQALVVDTRPPVVDSLRSSPPDGSLILGAPDPITITLVEPASSVPPASGPDMARSTIRVLGPLESTPTEIQTGTVTPFDSHTLVYRPAPGTFDDEGTYQVEIDAFDKAGNMQTAVFIYTLDRTPPSPDFLLDTFPSEGQALPTTGLPTTVAGRQLVRARFDVSSPTEFSLGRSSISLRNFCPVPFDVVGDGQIVLPDQRLLLFDTNLRADSSQDGLYTMQIRTADPAGNLQQPINVNFVIDNLPPVVLTGGQQSFPGSPIPTTVGAFPAPGAIVRGPLRQVSTLIQDAVAASGHTGSGVNGDPTTGTVIDLTLVGAHPTTTAPVGFSTATSNISTLAFEALEAGQDSPCFLGVRRSRALLVLFPDPLVGTPAGLPADGTFDGEWEVTVRAVDNAGNVAAPIATRFTYDTVPPFVELDLVLNDRVFTGDRLNLTGRARDNDKGPRDIGRGLRRVQVRLEAESPSGVSTLPPLIDFTDAILTPSPALVESEVELPWRIDQRIPAFQGPARLIVRAEDMAGNETFLLRELILNVNPLPAPVLVSPKNREDQPGAVRRFEWQAVEGASGYELTLRDENGNETTRLVDRPFRFVDVNLAMLPEGRYTWTVRAVDTGGTRGAPAFMRTFLLDKTPPRVLEIAPFDGTIPDAQATDAFGGQVRLAIEFSEPMDVTTAPTVLLDPADPLVGPLAVQPLLYEGTHFRGLVNIPPAADFPDVNGLATVIVRDATDTAGNPLAETRRNFEVDIGPFWEVRAFANPVLKREVLFHFKARTRDRGPLETVSGFPHVTVEQENAARPRFLELRRLAPSIFVGTYEVDRTLPGNAVLRITATDDRGNTTTRALAFSIAAILRADQNVFRVATGALKMWVPAGAVGQDETVVLLPASMDGDEPASEPHPELEEVRRLEKLLPGALALARPGMVEVDLEVLKLDGSEAGKGLGLYLRHGKSYQHLRSTRAGARLSAPTRELGSFALLRDLVAPRLRPAGGVAVARAGMALELDVEELGSGAAPRSAAARLGDRVLPVRWLDGSGRVRVELPGRIPPGASLEVSLEDEAGNTGRAFLPVVAAGGSLSEATLYPNPARSRVTLRYQLAAPAQAVAARVLDSAGRRLRSLPGGTGAGLQEIGWDLRSGRGRVVANGVYFVELEVVGASGHRESRRLKLAVLR